MGLDPISLGLEGAGMISSLIGGILGNHKMKKIQGQLEKQPTYQINPLAVQQQQLAQQMFNGRMPGASYAEQNILGNQANAMGQVDRNATDSGQALAIAAGLQGQTNKSLADLANQEAIDKANRFNQLAGSNAQLINEGDKAWQDQLRKQSQILNMQGARMQNTYNMFNGLGGVLGQAGNMYNQGFFNAGPNVRSAPMMFDNSQAQTLPMPSYQFQPNGLMANSFTPNLYYNAAK